MRVRNEVPRRTTQECDCIFRVLYKPGKLLICYGVEEKDKLDTMLSNPQQLKREFCCCTSARKQGWLLIRTSVEIEKSYIIPNYLYRQPDGRFVCTVFSGDETDEILSFSFASRDGKLLSRRRPLLKLTRPDAHMFQYALTRRKVEWESEIGYVHGNSPHLAPDLYLGG